MNRRLFLAVLPLLLVGATRKLHTFRFRIKTKSGSVVNNVTIEAFDVEAAKFKLKKRYPDCVILNLN
jgi:hypothetical protein